MLVVTAIHTFVAEHGDELEFSAGEKIEVIEKDEAFGDGWWRGRNTKGEEGLFPATYISEEGDVAPASIPPATDAGGDASTASAAAPAAAAAAAAAPSSQAATGGAAANQDLHDSRSGSPIPVPPSPVTQTHASEATPAAPDHSGQNGLASSFARGSANNSSTAAPAADDDSNRNSLLDITGAPRSAPMVQGRSNVMGTTIGEVQEAIETMGGPHSPSGHHQGVRLKDPQEAEQEANDTETDDDHAIGIASDARARLAEQAKLANDERARQAQRESGGVADLIYSDESDEEDESPSRNSRTFRGLNGIHGSSHSPTIHEALGEDAGNDDSTAKDKPRQKSLSATPTTGGATPIPANGGSAIPPPATAAPVSSAPPRSGIPVPVASALPMRVSPHHSASGSPRQPSQTAFGTPPLPTQTLQATPPIAHAETFPHSANHTPEFAQTSTLPSTGGLTAAGFGAVAAGAGAAYASNHTKSASGTPSPSLRSSSLPPGGSPGIRAAPLPTELASQQRLPQQTQQQPVQQAQPVHLTPTHQASAQLQPALPLPATPLAQDTNLAPGSAASSGARMPAKPPVTWTVDEVVAWARSRGFDDTICGKFIEHEISGDVLLELDATLLKELDIPQFGKRVRIASAINELRRPPSSVSQSSGAQQYAMPPPGTLPTSLPPSAQHSPLPATDHRTASAPPSAYATTPASASANAPGAVSAHSTPTMTSPVIDDHHGGWAHGRKVSAPPSTHPIDESRAIEEIKDESPPPNANGTRSGHRTQNSSSSLPASPATTGTMSTGVKEGLIKRESTGSLTHKKKGSVDKSDRLSFFGRGRKQPPPAPSTPSGGDRSASSRIGFTHNKATTTMTADKPDKRVSSGPTVAVGSALRQIGKPDKTGYLKKKGERYNTWKMRFFVLKGSHLYYLKSADEARVKGHIDLKGHRIISDENNPGHYGFRLVGPGHDGKAHYFSSSEQGVVRDWMKALMKATIVRDYSVPVTSSCNIPTIPLAEAQALQPRPPSPAERDATQRANRRENVNQLTPRDASVLMSLDTTGSQRRMTSHGGSVMQTPSRPSRDTRRPSISRSVGRPSIASYYPPDEEQRYTDLLKWVNHVLPIQYPRAAQFPNSFISGEVIFLIVKHLSGIERSPPVPSSAFAPDKTGMPNVDGLFAMMDMVIDAGIDYNGVSLNDIRAGDANAISILLDCVRTWSDQRGT